MQNLMLSAENPLGETLKEAMMPEKVNFMGINVGPSFFTALLVTALILIFCLAVRIFAVPKFKKVPGGFQIFLEDLVNFFDKTAGDSVRKYQSFIAPYIFTASIYICIGTLIEMLGIRPVLGDLNACIAMALFTYIQLVIYSLINKGPVKGLLHAGKEVTVAISFSFRLFGSILSGLLIMELIYSFIYISFVIPAALSIMFTVFHAFIQAYVFAMLSSLFLGEAIGENEKKKKSIKKLNKGITTV